MRAWFHNLKVSQKLMLISIFFLMPDSLMLYMFITGINSNIEFAQLEMKGNQYQRPLEILLEQIPTHELSAITNEPLADTEQKIDAAFKELARVDAQIGQDLQFTAAGLAKRNRSTCRADLVQQQWESLKADGPKLTPAQSSARHGALISDIRTMITHAGDMSNLILDPDLDSYYLMDVTLLGLPQTQGRLADILTKAASGAPSRESDATMLKEADLDRVQSSASTALNEDANSYGISPSLQSRLPVAMSSYLPATERFIDLCRKRAAGSADAVSPADFLAAGKAARSESFKLWHVAVDEEDKLLQTRISSYTDHRTRSLGVAALAFVAAVGLVTFITRSITIPLKAQARELLTVNGAMAAEVQRRREAEAAIRETNESLEVRVKRRTEALQNEIEERERSQAELAAAQTRLLEASRQAGKAEVATGVLHNVGNVLNSVNVSASVITRVLAESEMKSLVKLSQLIQDNKSDLATFFTTDPRGRIVPDFLAQVVKCLAGEQDRLAAESQSLSAGIEHINVIITAQQSMARKSVLLAEAKPAQVFDQAVTMQLDALDKQGVKVVRQYDDVPPLDIDVHKILQILTNLVGNARQAMAERPAGEQEITLILRRKAVDIGPESLLFEVKDTGEGIAREDMAKMFQHGFTTKSDGHGFGLHSAANAAREMGGSLSVKSDGRNRGATFTLEVPAKARKEEKVAA